MGHAAMEKASEAKRHVITKDRMGQQITVTQGDLIQIELPGMGGTGYLWHFRQFDRHYLQLLSEETRSLPAEGRLGGPVLHIWRLSAARPGRTEVSLDYYRPWEGVARAADHFSFTLNIVTKGGP